MGTLADLERIQWLKAAASLVILITRGISPAVIQTDLSCHGVEGRGENGRGSRRRWRRGRGWKEIGTSAV